MSNKLQSLAEILKQGVADKKAREAVELERKRIEGERSLGDLFKTVKAAKDEAVAKDVEKIVKIVDAIKQVEQEEGASEQEATQPPAPEEAAILKVIKQLQNDFKMLKAQVDSKATVSPLGFGGAGSGEVRITRMDDVDGLPSDGESLVWSAAENKFIYKTINSSSGEDMPFAKRVDFVSDTLIYKGEAEVGSYDIDPVWRIHRIVLGADDDVTETWANGTSSFSHSWIDRATYPYQ